MAHVEHAIGNGFRSIKPADYIGTTGILDFHLAIRNSIDFSCKKIIRFAPDRIAVDEGDIAKLCFARRV